MHRSSTDKVRCSKTGADSSDSGTGCAPMTTGGCSGGAGVRVSCGGGSSSSMRRPPSSGSSSGTGGCSGSSSTGAVSGTMPALLDLMRLPAACASPARCDLRRIFRECGPKQFGRYQVWMRCR